MARARSTKKGGAGKTVQPRYSYKVGPDGVPVVQPPDGSEPDKAQRWTCPCPLCLADASVGLDVNGRFFVVCGRCNIRMFTYSTTSNQLVRAWLRLHQRTPQALAPLRALLATALAQIQREDAAPPSPDQDN